MDGLDLPALDEFFARNVPGFAGSLSAEMLQGGRSNLTYLLTDGRTRWVLRRPPLGGLTPSAHDMGREYRVVAALRDSGVPVARAVALADADVLGVPFSVVEHVDGVGLAPARAGTAGRLRHGERGAPDLAGEQGPQLTVRGLGGFGPRQHRVPRTAFLQQSTHARPQVLLDLGVQQVTGTRCRIGHRGRSFHAVSLSTLGSAGSPSTRSAMMLRMISEVPPSIELPFARRNRHPAGLSAGETSTGRRVV